MSETTESTRPNRGDSTRSQLLALIEEADLFHTPDGHPYVSVHVDGHTETHPVSGEAFADYLRAAHFRQHGAAPSGMAVRDAIDHAAALARYDGLERPVWLRVAEHGDCLYLDLCDESWRVVEIDRAGWRIVTDPPVRFRRPGPARALPVPVLGRGAYLTALERYVRLRPEDIVLLSAFIVQAVRPRGPYPLLVVTGEQGAGKTFLTELLKALIDPSSIPTRSPPRNERDLLIAAENTHLLTFNNLSGIKTWLSDALCCLLFGSGVATRRLHTDRVEEVFFYSRPVIINGIENMTSRPDLADRAIVLHLQPIPEAERRTEDELREAFRADLPRLLGGLLDTVVTALDRLDFIRGQRLALPRMADFAQWATAAELVFSHPEISFLDAYRANRAQTAAETMDLDPVAEAVLALVADTGEWTGTMTELLLQLKEWFVDGVPSDFPTRAQSMAGRLGRIAPFLRTENVEIERPTRTGRRRSLRIWRSNTSS